MADLASEICAKRDELQALINKALAAGMRVQMPYGALQALTVSVTAKSLAAQPQESAAAVAGTEEPETQPEGEKPSAGSRFSAKGLFRQGTG